MDWSIAGYLLSALGGGGLGAKIADWLRERDARQHQAEQEDDRTAQAILAERVQRLEQELRRMEDLLRTAEEERNRLEIRLRLRIARLAHKVTVLEGERDSAYAGYKRLEAELAEERARVKRLEAELQLVRINEGPDEGPSVCTEVQP
ncbi:MAG: hypothetical protein AMXMBFR33_01330 [Candidatus Xenobia bacterium]